VSENTMHIQITGDLPWVVCGWRTYPEHGDIEPELVAVYGPLPTQGDAAALVATLMEAFPTREENFTAMQSFPVRLAPGGSDSAVVA
jgi:hypothetical protein